MNPQYHSGFGPGAPPHGGGIQVSAAPPSRPHLHGQNMYNGPNMVQRPPGIRGNFYKLFSYPVYILNRCFESGFIK